MPLAEQSVSIISAAKTSSQSRNNTIITLADLQLRIPVVANVAYDINAYIIVNVAGALPGFRYTWLVPTHTFGNVSTIEQDIAVGFNANSGNAGSWSAISVIALAGGSTTAFRITGTIQPQTDGNIIFTWAQNFADPANTTVLGGSSLRAIATRI